jgi:hypothetical protein
MRHVVTQVTIAYISFIAVLTGTPSDRDPPTGPTHELV